LPGDRENRTFTERLLKEILTLLRLSNCGKACCSEDNFQDDSDSSIGFKSAINGYFQKTGTGSGDFHKF
jgi:hypothetical protein